MCPKVKCVLFAVTEECPHIRASLWEWECLHTVVLPSSCWIPLQCLDLPESHYRSFTEAHCQLKRVTYTSSQVKNPEVIPTLELKP